MATYTGRMVIAGSNVRVTSGKMPPMPGPGIFKAEIGRLVMPVTDTSSSLRRATGAMCRMIVPGRMLIASNNQVII